MLNDNPTAAELAKLTLDLKQKAQQLGFADLRITDTDVSQYAEHYLDWVKQGYQGSMQWLANNQDKRCQPDLLHHGSKRIISVRLNYLPSKALKPALANKQQAYIARYALGRDYHKMMRKRIALLGEFLQQQAKEIDYRAFVDSAPVLERPIAEKAGLGWIGKNTLLLNAQAGSWFFLGELFINLPLPIDPPQTSNHCGSCQSCLDVCPTQAFVKPWVLDARKCISYLTIEFDGSIPEELRSKMGNRIYGCDDCQIFCPWTKFTPITDEKDFWPRHQLDQLNLLELFAWSEEEFLQKTQGSAIRRTGFANWQRNIAVALGNADYAQAIISLLKQKLGLVNDLVDEHILWAIAQQLKKESLIAKV